MKIISTLIVDDEQKARRGLQVLLEKDPAFEMVGSCKNGLEAIKSIRKLKPDLLLLDIQMPEINGFEVLNSLREEETPAVIFVTAYDTFALEAFENHALDYLLKPFSNRRFYEALNHAKDRIFSDTLLKQLRERQRVMLDMVGHESTDHDRLVKDPDAPRDPERLIIKSDRKIHFIDYDDIIWIEAYDYYIKIHLHDTSYMVRSSLVRMEQQLPADRFVRVHRSSIVHVKSIERMEPHRYGAYWIILENGDRIKLSRHYKKKYAAGLLSG